MIHVPSLWLICITLPFCQCALAPASDRPSVRPAPLQSAWTAPLDVHSPTNVVVGRIGDEKQLCVQGAFFEGNRKLAAIQMLNDQGRILWSEQHGEDGLSFGPGAYLQWISGGVSSRPAVLYSYVPAMDQRLGGARLIAADDGQMLAEIQNLTRFGNNNSIVDDLDNDGVPELLYGDQSSITRYTLPGMQQQWHWDSGVRFCWSLPGLFDLNADQQPEIVFGSEYNNDNGSSSVLAVSVEGKPVWRSDGFKEDLGSTPIFHADVDNDGTAEILNVGLDLEHHNNQTWNHLHVLRSKDGTLLSMIEIGFTGIALGDMDQDGHLDCVGLTNTRDGGRNGHQEIRCIDLVTGKPKWSTLVPRAYLDTNSPVMADITGDGHLEAVVGTGNPAGYARLPNSKPWGDLYVVDRTGNIIQRECMDGWPVNLAFCDLDDDGLSELIVVQDGKPGTLRVYKTRAPAKQQTWPTPFGNSQRSGTSAFD